MNSNTIAAYSGGTKRNQIPAQVVSTTTETVFLTTTDTGTAPAVLSIPGQTAIVGASNPLDPNANPAITGAGGRQYGPPFGSDRPFFNSTSFDSGKPFKVRVQGTFTSGVAANDLQIALYRGSSATVGSDNLISAAVNTGTSGDFGAVTGKFLAEYILTWDSTSGKLDGIVNFGLIVPTGVAGTVITTAVTTEVSAAAVANLQFVASAKWNAANAGNTVNVAEFSIEQY